MNNPFITSGKIRPEYFCGRRNECALIAKAVDNGNNLVLVSPRRMGKTGLVHFYYDKPEVRDKHYCRNPDWRLFIFYTFFNRSMAPSIFSKWNSERILSMSACILSLQRFPIEPSWVWLICFSGLKLPASMSSPTFLYASRNGIPSRARRFTSSTEKIGS